MLRSGARTGHGTEPVARLVPPTGTARRGSRERLGSRPEQPVPACPSRPRSACGADRESRTRVRLNRTGHYPPPSLTGSGARCRFGGSASSARRDQPVHRDLGTSDHQVGVNRGDVAAGSEVRALGERRAVGDVAGCVLVEERAVEHRGQSSDAGVAVDESNFAKQRCTRIRRELAADDLLSLRCVPIDDSARLESERKPLDDKTWPRRERASCTYDALCSRRIWRREDLFGREVVTEPHPVDRFGIARNPVRYVEQADSEVRPWAGASKRCRFNVSARWANRARCVCQLATTSSSSSLTARSTAFQRAARSGVPYTCSAQPALGAATIVQLIVRSTVLISMSRLKMSRGCARPRRFSSLPSKMPGVASPRIRISAACSSCISSTRRRSHGGEYPSISSSAFSTNDRRTA